MSRRLSDSFTAQPGSDRQTGTVLCLIDSLAMGGTEQSLLALACRFRRLHPIVVSLHRGDALRSAYAAAGVRVQPLDLSRRWSLLRAISSVRQIVREVKPVLLHASLFRASLVARIVGRLEGIPVVGTLVNESYARERLANMSRSLRMKMRIVLAVDRVTASWVAHHVANSEASRRAGVTALGLSLERTSVVFRGRDPTRFQSILTPSERRALIDDLCLDDGPILLNVARLLPRKGHGELLAALRFVRTSGRPAQLVLAGDGPNLPYIKSLVRQLGLQDAVRLLGERSDIPRLLALCDLFVFPSHWEGLPGALIEALMASKPVVATDIAPHRELVDHGVSGLLVPVNAPDALALAVNQLLDAPQTSAELGRRAGLSAVSRFDINRVARQYEDLLLSVLEATPA